MCIRDRGGEPSPASSLLSPDAAELLEELELIVSNTNTVENEESEQLQGSMLELFEAKRKRGANGYGAFSPIFSEALSGHPLLGHTPIIIFFILYIIYIYSILKSNTLAIWLGIHLTHRSAPARNKKIRAMELFMLLCAPDETAALCRL